MAPPIIAVVSPGAMGAAIGARLTSHSLKVLTHIPPGRSQGSHDRARDAKMVPTDLATIAREADWVLSVLPPSSAVEFAEEFVAAVKQLPPGERRKGKPAFADCNAVNPSTMVRIEELIGRKGLGLSLVDGSIIGGPPRAGYDPVIYASAEESKEGALALKEFEGLKEYGLKVSVLTGEGAGVGAASALKMSYAGITKGFTGLATTMILAAYANSPATAHALIQELSQSQSQKLTQLIRGIPDMLPKAYRFHGEMDEIADFVAEGERSAGVLDEAGGSASDVHHGLASTYRRVAKAVKENGEDLRLLKDFVSNAKGVLEAKDEKKV